MRRRVWNHAVQDCRPALLSTTPCKRPHSRPRLARLAEDKRRELAIIANDYSFSEFNKIVAAALRAGSVALERNVYEVEVPARVVSPNRHSREPKACCEEKKLWREGHRTP